MFAIFHCDKKKNLSRRGITKTHLYLSYCIGIIIALGMLPSTISVAKIAWDLTPYMKFEVGYGFTSGLKYNTKYGESTPSAQLGQTWTSAMTASSQASVAPITPDKQASGLSFSGGIGCNLLRFVRSDIMLSYLQLKNTPAKSGSGTNIVYREPFYQKSQEIRGMLNLYLQIPITVDIIPFIGGGFGFSSQKYTVLFTNTSSKRIPTLTSDGQYDTATAPNASFIANFIQLPNDTLDPQTTSSLPSVAEYKGMNVVSGAYSISMGVAYQISDGVFIDFSYRMERAKEYQKEKFHGNGVMRQEIVVVNSSPVFTSPEYQSYSDLSLSRFTKNIISLGIRSEF